MRKLDCLIPAWDMEEIRFYAKRMFPHSSDRQAYFSYVLDVLDERIREERWRDPGRSRWLKFYSSTSALERKGLAYLLDPYPAELSSRSRSDAKIEDHHQTLRLLLLLERRRLSLRERQRLAGQLGQFPSLIPHLFRSGLVAYLVEPERGFQWLGTEAELVFFWKACNENGVFGAKTPLAIMTRVFVNKRGRPFKAKQLRVVKSDQFTQPAADRCDLVRSAVSGEIP